MNAPLRLRVLPALIPVNGRPVEMQASDTHIQYRLVGDPNWIDIVLLSDITGPAGPAIEMQSNDTYLQYRPIGTDAWFDLILLSDIKGDTGLQGPVGPAGPPVSDGDKGDVVVTGGGAAWQVPELDTKPTHFPTFDDAEAGAVPDDVTGVTVAGRAAVGDFGAAAYEKVGSLPTYGGMQIGSFFFKNTAKDFTPEHCGAVGDGIADDDVALYDWLMGAADEGRKAVTRGGKTYMVTDPVIAIIEKGLTVEGTKGTIIKGAAGPGVVLDIKNNTVSSSAAYPDLSFSGITVDNSLRDFDAAVQSGTGLSLIRLGKVEIYNSRFMGDPLFDADPDPETWAKGDSGVTAVTCLDMNVHDNYFAHQPDLGLYLTGGPDTGPSDDFGEWKTYANQFFHCNAGFAAKRQTRRVLFANNIVRRMISTGYLGTSGATGTGDVPMISAREQVITGNIFSECQLRAITLDSSTGDVVADNQIVDWGNLFDGTTGSSVREAIRLLGCTGTNITGNNIRLRSWSNSSTHTAIALGQTSFAGNAQTTSCLIDNNNIAGCTKGIIEYNSSSSNLIGDGNRFSGTTTEKITKASGSTSGGYSIQADASPAFGTVNAGTRTQVSVAVTGVEEGDAAIYQPGGATAFINGIVYEVRCTTGAVLIDARNTTTGANIAVPTVAGKLRIFKPKP